MGWSITLAKRAGQDIRSCIKVGTMSQLGHSRRFGRYGLMSALPSTMEVRATLLN